MWPAPVTLSDRHVTLAPLGQAHCADLQKASAVGELYRLWYAFVPAPEQMGAEIDRRLALQAAGTMLPFAICLPDSTAIGMTTYMNIDAANKRFEIGSTWLGRANLDWRLQQPRP